MNRLFRVGRVDDRVRRLGNTGRRIAIRAVVVGVLVAAPAFAAAGHAEAEIIPTEFERLQQCEMKHAVCTFHQSGAPEPYQAPQELVSGLKHNCNTPKYTTSLTWSKTDGEKDWINSSVILTSENAFAGKGTPFYKVKLTASYGHSWGTSETYGGTTSLDLFPGQIGGIYRNANMQTVRGWWEIHLPRRWYGHYIWYVWGYATQGGAPVLGDGAYPASRQMTQAEWDANCAGIPRASA